LKPDEWSVWYLRGVFHDSIVPEYAAAVRDYSKAIELGMDVWIVHYRRGVAYAQLGQWDNAAADVAKAPWMERGMQGPLPWQVEALALLAAGDTSGYRRVCARLLKHLGQTEDPNTPNNIIWVCVLGPGSVVEIDSCLQWMEKAVARQPNYELLNTLGATLHRAGRFEAAIERLNEAIKSHGKDGTAADWLFLAMAQYRLGRAEEARQALDKAARWMEQAEQGQLQDEHVKLPLSWHDRLEFQLLRREAEKLIKSGEP
jgi:tetratricopeptide (TPR) repeat protein